MCVFSQISYINFNKPNGMDFPIETLTWRDRGLQLIRFVPLKVAATLSLLYLDHCSITLTLHCDVGLR